MQTIHDLVKTEQNKNKLTMVSLFTESGGNMILTFILSDAKEGRFVGQRVFPVWTEFTDHGDFVDELWCSNDLLKLE